MKMHVNKSHLYIAFFHTKYILAIKTTFGTI